MGLEPTNLLTASQALYQLSYAPVATRTVHNRPGDVLQCCQVGCAFAGVSRPDESTGTAMVAEPGVGTHRFGVHPGEAPQPTLAPGAGGGRCRP